jgi:hypothetical protein
MPATKGCDTVPAALSTRDLFDVIHCWSKNCTGRVAISERYSTSVLTRQEGRPDRKCNIGVRGRPVQQKCGVAPANQGCSKAVVSASMVLGIWVGTFQEEFNKVVRLVTLPSGMLLCWAYCPV